MRLLLTGLFLVIATACSQASNSSGQQTPSKGSAGSSSGSTGLSGGTAGTGASAGTSTGVGGTAGLAGTGGVAGEGGSEINTGGTNAATGGANDAGTGGTATAGTSGTGGAAAAAGSGGDAGSSGSGGMPATGSLGCNGSELLCEDFEMVADGMVPTGGPWQPLDSSCEFQTGSFTMGVTGELANGGEKALKVTNKHFAQCRLSGKFDTVDEFWIRAYSYWEGALDISNRETLDIDLTPGYRTADDPAVRFGYRSKSPCEEYAGPQVTIIGLGTGEVTGCGSRPMPQDEWFCFEAHVQQAENLVVATYINGEAISYQSTGKPMTDTVATESAISDKVDHIRLGIFSTGEAQGSIYLDDVAVSTTRIGCAN